MTVPRTPTVIVLGLNAADSNASTGTALPINLSHREYRPSQWYGVAAPKNTPAEIVNRLNREINTVLEDTNLRRRMIDLGGTPLPGSPADFSRLVAADTEKWGKVVKASGLKAD